VTELDDLLAPLDRTGLDPGPWLTGQQARGPVTRLDLFGNPLWLVTGHTEVRTVLADSRTFSNDFAHLSGTQGEDLELANPGGLGQVDPPDHTRLRRLLVPAFTPRKIAALQPAVERIVHRRLAALAAAGPGGDLVGEFATPVPAMVIGELLGVPDADLDAFAEVSTGRFDLLDNLFAPIESTSRSLEFLADVVASQRSRPGAGLIGDIVREHGTEVSDDELAGLVDGLLVGGHETTASMLALGALVLMQDPAAAGLIADPATSAPVVEELLRYLTVVQVAFPRFPREDVVIGGQDIRVGEPVLCSLLAADRDHRLAENAASFAGQRAPTRHLAFGHGIHHCLGAPLARLELAIALPALVDHFPGLRPVDRSALAYRRRSLVFGLHALPVTWDID
jgi:cytochrome P450